MTKKKSKMSWKPLSYPVKIISPPSASLCIVSECKWVKVIHVCCHAVFSGQH